MRKLLLTILWGLFLLPSDAQSVSEDIHHDVRCTASNYMAYPEPSAKPLTPAPDGMKPFYISHYGRHGSRWHNKPSMYDAPYHTLAKADSLGKLTPLGRSVMLRLDTIRRDAENRWGELTPLGVQQQRQIARRMTERFPEVFEGKTTVNARSTSVGRCILSMENFLLQLLKYNPALKIHHNATHRDLDYLNLQDKKLFALKSNTASNELYQNYIKQIETNSRLMRSLFNDSAYVSQHVDKTELDFQLLLVAAIMQNVELGKRLTLFDIYTEDELYRNWKIGNARWYIGWGGCTVNQGVQPYSQLEPHGWVNYRIFPMAANLQLVFYRRSPDDSDVRFKVLLNENEATLPLPTGQPPYYRWSDFRQYYLQKLDAYEE